MPIMPASATPVARGSEYAQLSSSTPAADEKAAAIGSRGADDDAARKESLAHMRSQLEHRAPPMWFDPAVRGPGCVAKILDRPIVAYAVSTLMTCGGLAFSSLFFVSAACDTRTAANKVQVLAGVGSLAFTGVAIHAFRSMRPIVRWKDEPSGKAGVLQQLYTTSDGDMGTNQMKRLLYWKRICIAIVVLVLSHFLLVAAACIELLVRDRSQPDTLSIVGSSLFELFPAAPPGQRCMSTESETMLLGLLLCTYVTSGVFVSFLGAGMLLAVGLGAEFAVDQIKDLRKAVDQETWPWITRRAVPLDTSLDGDDVYESIGTIARNRIEVIRLFRRIQRRGFAALRNQTPTEVITEQHIARMIQLCDEHPTVPNQPNHIRRGAVPDALVEQVMELLGYRLIKSARMLLADEVAWETEVRRPVVFLATKLLPLLEEYSESIGALFLSVWSVSLAMVPFAAATHNVFCLQLVAIFPIPLLVLGPMAVVGTSCDELLGDLNELRRYNLNVEQMCRIDNLQNYLRGKNNAQGLGFELFGVVMDKKKLLRISGLMGSALASAVVSLMRFGAVGGDGSGSTSSLGCTC